MAESYRSIITACEEAGDILGLSDSLRSQLLKTKRSTKVNLDIMMDDGSVQSFEGCRVQDNNLLGPPYGGGFYLDPHANEEEAKAKAKAMTLKHAVANIPFGGAKGYIAVDSRRLSEREMTQLLWKFVEEMQGVIGPYQDRLGPDMRTNDWHMAVIANAFGKIKPQDRPARAVATGKPLGAGGIPGRVEATGRGGFIILRETYKAMRDMIGSLGGRTLALQGFGNVGSNFAAFLEDADVKLIAVADEYGAIRNTRGLNVRALIEYQAASDKKSIVGFPEAEEIDPSDLWELPCDILVPAAISDVITEEIASRIHASVILELANNPTTTEGDAVLRQNGKVVIPHILANVGGATVSYFEWRSNIEIKDRGVFRWDIETVRRYLEKNMVKSFQRVFHIWQNHQKQGVRDLRTAAHVLAFHRLATAARDGTKHYGRGYEDALGIGDD